MNSKLRRYGWFRRCSDGFGKPSYAKFSATLGNTNDVSKATDAQLCLRYHEGRDQRAFAELVKRHGPMVMATTRRVLGVQNDCHDAFQTTFLPTAGGDRIVLPYDVRQEDTELRFDMVGDNFKLWVWQANGGTMPAEPQFDWHDGVYTDAGTISITAGKLAPATGPGTAIVDFIEIKEVPEATGAAIGLIGIVSCVTGIRRYRRRRILT